MNRSNHPFAWLLTALCALLLSASVQAEQMFADDRYEIRYIAFNSTFVLPEVAERHGITRSATRGLINVHIAEKQTDGGSVAVAAELTGTTRNLLGQVQPITFTKIDEGEAIYYIGEFRFSDDENLTLELNVRPDPARSPYRIRFQQTFYVD